MPGGSAQRFFDTIFPVSQKTRSEVTEDGGQERYDKDLMRAIVLQVSCHKITDAIMTMLHFETTDKT